MTTDDVERFAEMLFGLAEIYGETVTEQRQRMYFAALSDMPIEQLERAAAKLAQSSKFFPKPVEFREVVAGGDDDRANQAWALFMRAVSDSSYASVRFYDSAMAYSINAVFGSWLQAGQMLHAGWVDDRGVNHGCSDEMVAHYRKSFITQYLAFCRNPHDIEMYAAGQAEMSMRGGSAWTARMPEIFQPVLLVGKNHIKEIRLPFDTQAGLLRADARTALNAGPQEAISLAARLLPPAPVQMKALPAADANEPATPEEVAEILRAIRIMAGGNVRRMPDVTDEEIAAEAEEQEVA